MYAIDRRRQTSDAHHRLMPPTIGRRHKNLRYMYGVYATLSDECIAAIRYARRFTALLRVCLYFPRCQLSSNNVRQRLKSSSEWFQNYCSLSTSFLHGLPT